jgi:glycosyltransferase involved in cell wall biosynthesis
MTPEITVIIPLRDTDTAEITLNSLAQQTFKDFKVIEVKDQGKGAPWARNQGFKQVKSEFVLFSDGDIEWKSRALETMLKTLKMSKASYCYGRYKLNDDIWSHEPWDANLLKQKNYISTMSLIRTANLPERPWDESIKRLQDWDLWLTLLEQGKRGVYCEDLIFETKMKDGISFGNSLTYVDAVLLVKKKHGLE